MAPKTQNPEDLADILFPTEEEVEVGESILTIPPEQRRLHTETYDFTVSTLVSYLTDKKLIVPEFQRRYVWSDGQASRLIESLIIQCPIPVIYLSQQKDENLAVIDGNQRLGSLRRYIDNEFSLTGLTAYPELHGLRFHQLDPRFQRHILNRTIRCLVILKDTHPQVKFDVFERLNSGAVKLTAQELRHGLYHGDLLELAEQLAKAKDFSSLVKIKHNKRMKLDELVIRYFAFRYHLDAYDKPLSDFLNRICDMHRAMDPKTRAEYKSDFERTSKTARSLYGPSAFSIPDNAGHEKNPFNAALYDAEMVAAASLSERDVLPDRSRVLAAIGDLFANDTKFRKSVTQATSDKPQVLYRIQALAEAISRL